MRVWDTPVPPHTSGAPVVDSDVVAEVPDSVGSDVVAEVPDTVGSDVALSVDVAGLASVSAV
jgi:hypothetical protein